MVELSPGMVVLVMFGVAILGILLGYPLPFVLGGVAIFIGLLTIGPPAFHLVHRKVYAMMYNYVLLAVPLFVFMGVMMEKSGAAERLYGGLYLWFGGFRGGLAIGTVLMGTIVAACVGVIAASVTMIALIAVPSMLQRGYDKEIVCGSVCAGGTLGILIPPSIMLVIYGPMAQLSVGKLFFGAFVPGFVLSGLYVTYIAIRCLLKPELAPALPAEERRIPLTKKLAVLVTSLVPPVFIIMSVLGSIFFGIATPTEAASLGCIASTILAVCYRNLNWENLKDVLVRTMRFSAMALFIGYSANMFTGVFLRLGGGEAVSNFLLAAPGGRWGTFAVIMFLIFILGFFIDWMGILFIMVPLVTPIVGPLGFDPLWFALMICINLQMSFMTPPFAYAIFYLKGLVRPEWGIDIMHIIRGVIPYVILIMVGLGLCIAFPDIIMWLPQQMIKF